MDERQSNREAMPMAAEIVDAFVAVFGAVKVMYCSEAGHERGKSFFNQGE